MKNTTRLAIAVFVVLLYICIRAFMKKMKQTRELDKGSLEAQGEIARRLQSVAPALGGTFVDGPALQTAKGKLAMLATKAPQDPAINVTKMTVTLTSPHALTVIPVEDAAKAVHAKSVHPVDGLDAGVAAAFKVFSSDADFGRRVATVELADRLRELAKSTGARPRLQVALHSATVLIERGLDKPEELQAFHDGSHAVVAAFQKLAG